MAKSNIHLNTSERKLLLRFFDLVFVGGALYLVNYFFAFDYFKITNSNWLWVILLAAYLLIFGGVFELYNLRKASKLETTFPSIFFTVLFTVLLFLFTPYFAPSLPTNRIQVLYFFLVIFFPLVFWRMVYVRFFSSALFHRKGLIIGDISNIASMLRSFKEADPNYQIIGYINSEEDKKETVKYKGIPEFKVSEIFQIITRYNVSEVIVASNTSETMTSEVYNDIVRMLERGFPIKGYTQVYEELARKIPVQHVGVDFYKHLAFNKNNRNRLYLTLRRFIDVICAILGLFVGVLLFPIVLIGNCIANKGPLFYVQERVGEYGKVFKIIKYRSMVVNAEAEGAKWAQKNDVRITKFGRFLRRSRLDEFPQFFNILKGDMSVIGPRPERPHLVKELSRIIPFYQTRHVIKPGLTGWAQVKSRYGSSVDDSLIKLQYDLYYIKHRDFVLDFNIMIKTISTVIFFRGQ